MWRSLTSSISSATQAFQETFKEEPEVDVEAQFIIDDTPEVLTYPSNNQVSSAIFPFAPTSTSSPPQQPPIRPISDDTTATTTSTPPRNASGLFASALSDPNALLTNAANRAKLVATSATSAATSVGSKAREAIGRSGIPVVSAAVAPAPPQQAATTAGGIASKLLKAKRGTVAVCLCVVLMLVGPPILNFVSSAATAVHAIVGTTTTTSEIGGVHESLHANHHPNLHHNGDGRCVIEANPGSREDLLHSLQSILSHENDGEGWELMEDLTPTIAMHEEDHHHPEHKVRGASFVITEKVVEVVVTEERTVASRKKRVCDDDCWNKQVKPYTHAVRGCEHVLGVDEYHPVGVVVREDVVSGAHHRHHHGGALEKGEEGGGEEEHLAGSVVEHLAGSIGAVVEHHSEKNAE